MTHFRTGHHHSCLCGACDEIAPTASTLDALRADAELGRVVRELGLDADGVRAIAAALAVFPTLDAKVRAELGECP